MPHVAPPNTPDDPVSAAHLEQLHTMSTTAGVTNQGYVAVNQTAIVALLLGFASALAFMGWLLLVIPVAGVIVAVVAMRQIGDSNGTQTGKGMALAGLALSILCVVGVVAVKGAAYLSARGDANGIARTVADVGRLVREKKFDQAYALFDDSFRQSVKPDRFKGVWESAEKYFGPLEELEWNQVEPRFETAGGARVATIMMRAKFARVADDRYEVVLRKAGDQWRIAKFPRFFPIEEAQSPADKFEL